MFNHADACSAPNGISQANSSIITNVPRTITRVTNAPFVGFADPSAGWGAPSTYSAAAPETALSKNSSDKRERKMDEEGSLSPYHFSLNGHLIDNPLSRQE